MWNFIHIPKVAGSSLYNLIGGGRAINYCGHIRISDLKFFCFVRNPYDRLVDAYVYLVGGGGNVEPDVTYQKMLLKYNDFTDFVLSIKKDELINFIIHIRPMSWYVCNEFGRLMAEFFKLEEMEKIDEFISSCGYERKLSETFVNVTERKHYTEYLNPENIKEINRLYAKDFELFDYDKL